MQIVFIFEVYKVALYKVVNMCDAEINGFLQIIVLNIFTIKVYSKLSSVLNKYELIFLVTFSIAIFNIFL